MRRRILLTGPPGCGKTTIVRKVAGILRGKATGFYTEEIRDAKKQRIGFRVVTLDGNRGTLADRSSGRGPRVGSYRVNVQSFERVALPSLEMEEGRSLSWMRDAHAEDRTMNKPQVTSPGFPITG